MNKKQLLSALVTFVVYCLIFSWKISLLLMLLVSFHELGHLLAAHHSGLKTKGMYLIPFVGGAAIINDRFKTAAQKAYVILMGPAFGAILSLGAFALYYFTGNLYFKIIAYSSAIMNVFNLIPISFLDGGQLLDSITYSINNKFGFCCRVIAATVAIPILWNLNKAIALISLFFSAKSIYEEYKNFNEIVREVPMSKSIISLTMLSYFSLVVTLLCLIKKSEIDSIIDFLK